MNRLNKASHCAVVENRYSKVDKKIQFAKAVARSLFTPTA
jgi:hypothetical protein